MTTAPSTNAVAEIASVLDDIEIPIYRLGAFLSALDCMAASDRQPDTDAWTAVIEAASADADALKAAHEKMHAIACGRGREGDHA